jgi:hypothetical protein
MTSKYGTDLTLKSRRACASFYFISKPHFSSDCLKDRGWTFLWELVYAEKHLVPQTIHLVPQTISGWPTASANAQHFCLLLSPGQWDIEYTAYIHAVFALPWQVRADMLCYKCNRCSSVRPK